MGIRLCGLLLLAVSFAGLFLPRTIVGDPNPVLRDARDALHVPGFVLVTFGLSLLFRFRGRTWPVLAPFIVAILLAGATELLQPLFGRGARWNDFFANLTGVAMGTAGILVFRKLVRPASKAAFALVFAGLLALFAIPFVKHERNVRWLSGRFPLLAEFGDERILRFAYPFTKGTLEIVPDPSKGEPAVKLGTSANATSSVALFVAKPAWSEFESLKFAFENPGTQLRLTIGVDDRAGYGRGRAERFLQSYLLEAGESAILIPLEDIENGPEKRQLDLDRICRITIRIAKPDSPSGCFLRRVWLD